MKIFVNSRLYEKGSTGIAYYVQSLYSTLKNIDKSNDYTFLQIGNGKKLGKTITGGSKSIVGAFIFDLFLAARLLPENSGETVFHGPANLLPFLKPEGVKFVVTIHDLSFIKYPQYQTKLFNRYYYYAVRRSLITADVVIADSCNTKKDIQRYYKTPSSKIIVIYPGINKTFINAKKLKRIIEGRYFFSICTHPKRKNILSVIEVFSTNKDLECLKYVIAGLLSIQHRQELEKKITELGLDGRVIILGYVDEKSLVSLYQNAEFFIYPSFYEGFGFPVLEAMISGCPVITSNNSSLTEITPDENWLIDPHNLVDISDKMSKLTLQPKKERKKLIEKNFNFAKHFTWEESAKRVLEIFNRLMQ